MLFVAKDNTLYALGSNYRHALAHEDTEVKTNIVPLPGEVVQVATGEHHSLALLKDGRVYGWGDNRNNELALEEEGGKPSEQVIVPTLIPLSIREKIISIHAGAHSSVFRISDFRICVTDMVIPIFLDLASPIVSISCGWSHTLVLTKNGLYGYGVNPDGEMGCKEPENHESPTLLPLQDIASVACGTNFSLFLTSRGSLLSSGYNDYASLGLQSTEPPTEIPAVALERGVVGVAAGGFHGFALMEDGGVLGWGWNCFQQVGEAGVQRFIKQLRVFGDDVREGKDAGENSKGEREEKGEGAGAEKNGKEIVGIGCAWSFSWVTTKDHSLYIFGDLGFGFQDVTYSRESGKIQKAPFKVKLPVYIKEERWREIFRWMFLGGIDKDSFFRELPVEVTYHLVGLLL
jgi:alpha-tubulin suppressor-like RCC1 family protein